MTLAELGDLVQKVRSKNAGPFWLTIDIFCGNETAFQKVQRCLADSAVAQVLGTPMQELKRYDIPSLHVIKYSLPRPYTQGAADDRDMHGASWASLVAELEV